MGVESKTVKVDLAMAKITLIGAIKDVIQSIESYNVESTRDYKYRLIGTSVALRLVFGKELYNKIFAAVNHYDLDENNIAELVAIIEEINLKYPDNEIYFKKGR